MKHLAAILSFICLMSFSMAQRQVSGTVLGKRTQTPISNVRIAFGNESVAIQPDGTFILKNIPEKGKVSLTISAPGHKTETFNVKDFDNGIYLLEESSALGTESNMIELDGDEDMGYGGQAVAGLQTQSEDIFDRTAGYNLGFAYFRVRGYDNENSTAYINGALMNDPENGRASWSEWGGINDATRNKEVVSGLKPNGFGFGNLGGGAHVDVLLPA